MIKSASLIGAALLVFGLAAGSMAADAPKSAAPMAADASSSDAPKAAHKHKAKKSKKAKKAKKTEGTGN